MHRTFVAVVLATLVAAPLIATPPPYYQRLLVPLSMSDLPGANGSMWATELWAVNSSDQPVDIAALPCLLGSTGCMPAVTIPANRSVKIAPLGDVSFPGVLVLVPTPAYQQVNFTLHVRDLSRQRDTWGTEIPVVRERSFFGTSGVSVTNIPFGPDYRQTLRIYALFYRFVDRRFRVELYAVTDSEDRLLRTVEVTPTIPPPPPPNQVPTPLAQITITDLFAVDTGGAERLRVTVKPLDDDSSALAFWAFVSITNNKTQQVTTAVPQ